MFSIKELFGKSPFDPLYEHMLKVRDCVMLLPDLIDKFLNEDFEGLNSVFEKICKAEHKADITKQEIRNHLPKRYFLPVDRGDILHFLNSQDSIADAVEDVAVILNLRKTKLPDYIKDEFKKLVDNILKTCEYTFDVSKEIKKLVETGFGGYEAEKVMDVIEKVGEAEWHADKNQMNISRKLFEMEKDLDPISIFVIDKIIVRLGRIANNAEKTADMMRNMLANK